MSGATGPQGPRGPVGVQGPSGITGQYGIEGIRGFPGRPFYPSSLQILQSSAPAVTSQPTGATGGASYGFFATRLFENATPALSSGNSTTISGLSNDAASGIITLPIGQYYIEACASMGNSGNSNSSIRFVESAGLESVITGMSTAAIASAMYLHGPLIVTTPTTYSLLQANFFAGTTVSPTYTSDYYSPTPSFTPPNVSLAIMKIV